VEAAPALDGTQLAPTEAATALEPATLARPSTRRRSEALRAPSLQKELALIGAAQVHLREGEPVRALRLLERHAKRFPKGALRQERSAARAIALCMTGRSEEGQRLARELARSAPESPLATRVSGACRAAAPAATP
jgi:hypothetical protein